MGKYKMEGWRGVVLSVKTHSEERLQIHSSRTYGQKATTFMSSRLWCDHPVDVSCSQWQWPILLMPTIVCTYIVHHYFIPPNVVQLYAPALWLNMWSGCSVKDSVQLPLKLLLQCIWLSHIWLTVFFLQVSTEFLVPHMFFIWLQSKDECFNSLLALPVQHWEQVGNPPTLRSVNHMQFT